MSDYLTFGGSPYLRLSSLFPAYKLPRARAWLKNYSPSSLILHEGAEWVEEEGYERCSADIDRVDPNRIQLAVVKARILKTHGQETADLFEKELLRMRAKEK